MKKINNDENPRILKSYEGNEYYGFSIIKNTLMNVDILERNLQVLSSALERHKRLLGFHVTLRFPDNFSLNVERKEKAISNFIASFKAKVKADLTRRKKRNGSVHHSEVFYVWVREINESINEHYHVFFLVNHDTYNKLGEFSFDGKGLYPLLSQAWCSALGLSYEGEKLMHVANCRKLFVNRVNDRVLTVRGMGSVYPQNKEFSEMFHWMSYLAKLDTKVIGLPGRNFGSSQC